MDCSIPHGGGGSSRTTQAAQLRENSTKFKCSWDLLGGPVVRTLPSNAGDAGSIPGWGTKIPPVSGQLSLCAATTEPACCNKRS